MKSLKEIPLVLVNYSLFKSLYYDIIRIFCRHNWIYWDIKLINEFHDGINGSIFRNNCRECQKCGRKERHKMVVGDFNWKQTYMDFPSHGKMIECEVRLLNQPETKSERRDRIIKEIVKK